MIVKQRHFRSYACSLLAWKWDPSSYYPSTDFDAGFSNYGSVRVLHCHRMV